MKLSVIIPIFNEQKTLCEIIAKVQNARLPESFDCEIIAVDDGSTDKSIEILKSFSGVADFKVLFHATNQGKTQAIRTGLAVATGDWVVVQDADLEYDPANFIDLLKPALAGQASVVYGSRFLGQRKSMHWINWLSNKVSNWTFVILYGTNITDINTCYKLFRKDVIDSVRIESERFAFETELTAKLVRRGIAILEVPIPYVARPVQEKKINWSTALGMYWGIIKYRFVKVS